MNVTKEFLDNKYAVFEKNKERYLEVIAKIRTSFDAMLADGDLSHIDGYETLYDSIEHIRTAESNRFDTIKAILEMEKEHGSKLSFIARPKNYQELLDHYVRCVLYIRRLELPLEKELHEEAISYLKETEISTYAVLMILSNELFEHKELLTKILYERLCDDLPLEEKVAHLKNYCMFLSSETAQLELAFAFVEANDAKNALGALKQIEHPSDEILEMMRKLEGIVYE